MNTQVPTITERHWDTDFVVVGGGLSGLCAAVAAARNGARVVLIQDRPVLGGNASSEIRVWVGGAYGDRLPDGSVLENREGGLIEELLLRNLYFNPLLRWSRWDQTMYAFARNEPNLRLLLNATVQDVCVEDGRIRSVTAWHLLEYCRYIVEATLFADCSGDSILRLSGARFTRGREGRDVFGESHAPEKSDNCTMGNSVMLTALPGQREHRPFRAPEWSPRYTPETMPLRGELRFASRKVLHPASLESGGLQDTIKDADAIRDELLGVAAGFWECAKNNTAEYNAGDWELCWCGSLPGKRENIRYIGDHIMTQNDIESGGDFPDAVGHGGWPMDDHFPEGYKYHKQTIFHPAPTVYGIPYRSLYSVNVENLFFAGRNVSVSHMALSSTRVMATCAVMGQAVGTAAALAVRYKTTPRGVHEAHLEELQDTLQRQDQFIPNRPRPIAAPSREGRISHEVLRDGMDRTRLDGDHGVWFQPNEACSYEFSAPRLLAGVRLVMDTDQKDNSRLRWRWETEDAYREMPPMLPRRFRIEVRSGGNWEVVTEVEDNFRRYWELSFAEREADALRIVWLEAWGESPMHVFSFEVF